MDMGLGASLRDSVSLNRGQLGPRIYWVLYIDEPKEW
jgi:hypothetical protein